MVKFKLPVTSADSILPDRLFHNSRASKSVDQRFPVAQNINHFDARAVKIVYCSETSYEGLEALNLSNDPSGMELGTPTKFTFPLFWPASEASSSCFSQAKSKETTLERADSITQLLMLVTAEKLGQMFITFFLSTFCQLLSLRF